jgi:hypothetical protein
MIRVLFGAGSAAAANGITADVDLLLDAGAAGSAGDDFTVAASVDGGAATGQGFGDGLDESVELSVGGGVVAAGAALEGYDETITAILNPGVAPATGFSSTIGVAFEPGETGLPAIGAAFEGGFFAGLISHTADGVATHALIVAPEETGATGTGYTITTNLAQKVSNTATANTFSPFDGAANTAAMVTAGIDDHPAAKFCTELTIGGYSDWYLPARYELDIAYFNLKPTTANNDTSWGINNYSVPKRTVNYATDDPLQTSVAAFQGSGGENFADNEHWSSNQGSASGRGIRIDFSSGLQRDTASSKTITQRVRAFRRIAL